MTGATQLLAVAVSTSVVLAFALAAAWLLRSQSASARHWVLAAALLCAATLPVLQAIVPAWQPVEPAQPDLAQAAVAAVRQWQFTPTLLNCVAVEVPITVHVKFSLDSANLQPAGRF
jgi:hypothetical protein